MVLAKLAQTYYSWGCWPSQVAGIVALHPCKQIGYRSKPYPQPLTTTACRRCHPAAAWEVAVQRAGGGNEVVREVASPLMV
jgi:hypothetical protein